MAEEQNRHIIRAVAPGSIAEQLSLAPGDELVRINGKKINDVFDYHYLTNEEYLKKNMRMTWGSVLWKG